ncbi:hypothetical protein ATO10_01310 [Actibacterium atlanticum]|uniref:Uncharacterized protein n=1 Tax=Actibacterium atlanticum TaxID=1461693 RepID=A0A058ZQB2_9RHOB|nr:hypothetical protein [Actibacterium atlanticum]KCV83357.1 hypothetical protein ATO10_01310 [Actibacterium atlanticum]
MKIRKTILSALRAGILCAVMLGVVAPKISAALIFVMPGFTSVVICTGAEMITLTLAPDGTPIEPQQIGAAPCVLSDLLQAAPAQIPLWRALELPQARLFAIKTSPLARATAFARPNPSRAPPVIL